MEHKKQEPHMVCGIQTTHSHSQGLKKLKHGQSLSLLRR